VILREEDVGGRERVERVTLNVNSVPSLFIPSISENFYMFSDNCINSISYCDMVLKCLHSALR